MPKQKMKFLWYEVGRIFCLAFCKLCFRFKISGKDNIPADGAFILVSNHQSFLDPVFCACGIKRQMNFLARDTLFKNPFFRWLCFSLNATPLRRGEADLSAMKTVIKKLQAGQPVLLFPEATRTSDGRIAQFKAGLSLLCRRGNAAIVPMLIDGAYECWPRHKKIFSLGKRIVVRYGKSIPANEAKTMPDEKLAEFLTSTIRQLQTEVHLQQGKEPFPYEQNP
jgi:1-acyl-sn-glycerol-3-phosphate acyltransferase